MVVVDVDRQGHGREQLLVVDAEPALVGRVHRDEDALTEIVGEPPL